MVQTSQKPMNGQLTDIVNGLLDIHAKRGASAFCDLDSETGIKVAKLIVEYISTKLSTDEKKDGDEPSDTPKLRYTPSNRCMPGDLESQREKVRQYVQEHY